MDIIDNLKKLGKNWRLLALVIWLLIGTAIIPYPNPVVNIIGILIFLPFLVFLMFLFLLSLVSKKNIFEYPPWKIILFLLISLPIMLLLAIILIVLFAISIITYFFFTSWFILYGSHLLGKRADKRLLKMPKGGAFLRTIVFFGGLAVSLLLLFFFLIGPNLYDFSVILKTPVDLPWYLNGVYLLVGGIIIGLTILSIIYMFKKSFSGWFGIFAILVSFYTLFLVLKIFLGMVETEPEEIGSIWAYISLIIPDLFIIFYSLSTLMGSQAELLSKRFKRFGLDTVIIWLILSKVTYEFIHYFPYEIFEYINFPLINILSEVDNDVINHIKNIAVLIFFIALLIIIGLYEIHKYHKNRVTEKEEGEKGKELISTEVSIDEPQAIIEEIDTAEEVSTQEETILDEETSTSGDNDISDSNDDINDSFNK